METAIPLFKNGLGNITSVTGDAVVATPLADPASGSAEGQPYQLASNVPVSAPGSQVAINRQIHETAVVAEMARYTAAGFIVVPDITLDVLSGYFGPVITTTIVDFGVASPGFPLPVTQYLVDIKTGNGTLSDNQAVGYAAIEDGSYIMSRGASSLAIVLRGSKCELMCRADRESL